MNIYKQLAEILVNKGAIDFTTIGNAAIVAEQSKVFLQNVVEQSSILREAQPVTMSSYKYNIDTIEGESFAFQPARSTFSDSDGTEPAFVMNQIDAVEYDVFYVLKDDSVARNQGLENIVEACYQAVEKRVFAEMPMVLYFGNTAITPGGTGTDLRKSTAFSGQDGWIKKAGVKIYGVESVALAGDEDFDPEDVEEMFEKMLTSVPAGKMGPITDWTYKVDWTTFNAYNDVIRARNTALVDATAQTYKNIKVEHDPALDNSLNLTRGGTGRVAVLTVVSNMFYGIYQDINFQTEHVVRQKGYDSSLTVRFGGHFQDANRCVVAFIEKPKV